MLQRGHDQNKKLVHCLVNDAFNLEKLSGDSTAVSSCVHLLLLGLHQLIAMDMKNVKILTAVHILIEPALKTISSQLSVMSCSDFLKNINQINRCN